MIVSNIRYSQKLENTSSWARETVLAIGPDPLLSWQENNKVSDMDMSTNKRKRAGVFGPDSDRLNGI